MDQLNIIIGLVIVFFTGFVVIFSFKDKGEL